MSNITNNGGTIFIFPIENNIYYRINNDGVARPINWPVTFVNSNPVEGNILTVSIYNITISNVSQYFITGSNYITYDADIIPVTISNVPNYPGLIYNGSFSVNGYSNITVQNINTTISGSTTLANFGGWICQTVFGSSASNILINNCSNDGNINGSLAGGICGSNIGSNSGNILITNCSNNGIISGTATGGICGSTAGFNNGTVTITNCSNSGVISGNYAGGICANNAGYINGTVSITNCTNSGVISGLFAGGITGDWFGLNTNKLCSIINCYNTGNINGSNAGGITGADVGYNSNSTYTPKILIENCYSLGNISTTAGGICGGTEGDPYYRNPIVNIKNCYTSYNSIADSGSEYISTSLPTGVRNSIIFTNVYTNLTSLWSDTNASSALSGALTIYRNSRLYKYYSNCGEVWYSNQNNTPFSFTTDLNTVPRRRIRN